MKDQSVRQQKQLQKKQKELEKWKRQLAKKPYFGYSAMLIVMISLVHLLDEYASSSSGAIQSSIINDLFVNQMGMDYTAGLSLMSVVSLLTLLASLAATFYKTLADRYGRRIFFILSALGMGGGMLICACAENAFFYFLGRTVIGFFTATDFQVLYAMEVSPSDKRGTFFSVTKSIGTIGIVLIAVVRGMFMGADGSNWRFVYLIPAIAGIGLSIIALFACRETDVFMRRRIETLERELSGEATEKDQKDEKVGLLPAFRMIIHNKQLRMQMISMALFMCAMMPFTGFYESLMTMSGMSTEAVTTALFAYPISWAVLLFISGFISDKKGRKFTVILFGVLAMLCQAGYIIGAGAGMHPMLVGLLLGGAIGSYWTSNNSISLMSAEVAPTRLRASIASVFGMVSLIVSLFATALFAWLVTIVPLKSLCLVGGVAALGLSMLFLVCTTKETAGMALDAE